MGIRYKRHQLDFVEEWERTTGHKWARSGDGFASDFRNNTQFIIDMATHIEREAGSYEARHPDEFDD